MIRLSKDRVLESFFIDDNGVITNKEGEVQKQTIGRNRPHFRRTPVHKIQMWTKYGWRDTKIWAIHHIDEDKSNNSISNLVFMTRREHTSYHFKNKPSWNKGKSSWNKGIKMSEEYRKKLSEAHLGKKVGPRSESTKQKMAEAHKGKKWYNDGVKNYYIFPEDALPIFQKGMLKRCKK